MKVEERWTTVDGLAIRYLASGNGPTVLMLHGGQAYLSSEIFKGVLGRIADHGFRAVAYDQPGFGQSDPPSDFGLAFRIRFVQRLMTALGIENAVLVGHAQAGGMVVRLALREPSLATAIVSVSNLTVLPPIAGREAPQRPPPPPTPAAEGPTLAEVRAELEDDVYHKDLATADVVKRLHLLSTKNRQVSIERARMREPWDDQPPIWERLNEISVPLLLMYGEADRAWAAQRAMTLRDLQPALDVRVIPESAHLLMWDAPDSFVAAVVEYARRGTGEWL